MTVGAAATNYTDAAVGALDIPSGQNITNAATWAAGNAYDDAVASANANTKDVQLVAGCFFTYFCAQYGAGNDGGGNNHARQRSGAALQEVSS